MNSALHISTPPLPTLSRLALPLVWTCLLLGLVCIPLFGAKPALVAFGLAGFLGATQLLPIHYSLLGFPLYLFLDGSLKILSNYHPVMHVGQDLYLLSLAARMILLQKGGRWTSTPLFPMFGLFFSTILLQYLNPFGLGLLPSLAGTKVYCSGILYFFLLYHGLPRYYVPHFICWIVVLGLLQAIAACVEYIFFPEQLLQLHPRYARIAGDRFVGQMFRPFGTTSAPGAPSMWIYLCAPFAYYLFCFGRAAHRTIAVLFFMLAVPTLVFCQTRSAMVMMVVMLVLAMIGPGARWIGKLVLAAAVLAGLGLLAQPELIRSRISEGIQSLNLDPARTYVLQNRINSLFERKAYAESRRGAVDQMIELGSQTPWGIGLSRVGAASALWGSRIEADQDFGKEWSFADNVYRAVFTELGLFGLLAWLGLVLSLSLMIVRKSLTSSEPRKRLLLWICGAYPLAILVAGWGSEGILYMPVAGFFWQALAIGLKESVHA